MSLYTGYQAVIDEIQQELGFTNEPKLVEELMRTKYHTLDGLTGATFRDEIILINGVIPHLTPDEIDFFLKVA